MEKVDEPEVWDRMIDIMREIFDEDDLELTRESTAADVEAWDSLMNIELVVALEHEFGFQFRTGEIAGMKTVGALADVISKHVTDGRS